MNVYEKSIFRLLEENEVLLEKEELYVKSDDLNSASLNILKEITSALGGKTNSNDLNIEIKKDVIKVNDKMLIVDEAVHFNRYRGETLRNEFYDNNSIQWKVGDYKRYCAKHESNALKSGLAQGIWSNNRANEIFGESSEPGDFFANGATGWKFIAIKDCLLDLYCKEKNLKLIRFPMQSNIMIKGKLESYGELLLYGDKSLRPFCFKLLARTIGLNPIV